MNISWYINDNQAITQRTTEVRYRIRLWGTDRSPYEREIEQTVMDEGTKMGGQSQDGEGEENEAGNMGRTAKMKDQSRVI